MNKYDLSNYSVMDIKEATNELTKDEANKEKLVLVYINSYVRQNINDMDILLYVSKNTGYFKSYIKKVLDKYIKLGYIKELF